MKSFIRTNLALLLLGTLPLDAQAQTPGYPAPEFAQQQWQFSDDDMGIDSAVPPPPSGQQIHLEDASSSSRIPTRTIGNTLPPPPGYRMQGGPANEPVKGPMYNVASRLDSPRQPSTPPPVTGQPVNRFMQPPMNSMQPPVPNMPYNPLPDTQAEFHGGPMNGSGVAYPMAPYLESVDPLRALEAKVDSLQCQLDSINTSGNCNGCDESTYASPGGFYFGAAAVFAKPHLKEAFQYSHTNFGTGTQRLIPFDYDYQASPRAWIGYKNSEGLGMRATYWGFNADGQNSSNTSDGLNAYGAHAVSIIFPANIFAINPGETLRNADSLKTQIFNYYGTYDMSAGGFEMSGGVGLRQANLTQSLNSSVSNANRIPIRQLQWERKYNGLGPSVSVDIKRHLGCSPFSVFTQAGGALLFGTKSIHRTVIGDQSPQQASPFLSLDDADEVVGIGEMNFGLEWSRQMASGRNLMVRGLYEGQLWSEAGAPTLGFLGFEGFGVQVELKH